MYVAVLPEKVKYRKKKFDAYETRNISCLLSLGLPRYLFPLGFPTMTFYEFLSCPYVLHPTPVSPSISAF